MKKRSSTLSITASLIGSALLIGPVGCTKNQNAAAPQAQPGQVTSAPQGTPQSAAAQTAVAAATELKIEDLVVGTGPEAKQGQKVTVDYTGWLTDGKEFDSSKKSGRKFEFQIGGGQVIQGWERGLVGMKVGGKRKLTIPPQLGYGERGAGGVIPPNATLIFEIELFKVE